MLLGHLAVLQGKSFDHWDHMNPMTVGRLPELATSGFPIFGIFSWYLDVASETDDTAATCTDLRSQEFRAVLKHHLHAIPSSVPTTKAWEYVFDAQKAGCLAGEIAATLVLVLNEMSSSRSKTRSTYLLERAEALIRRKELTASWLGGLQRNWMVWDILNAISRIHRTQQPAPDSEVAPPLNTCIILIYTFPTKRIEEDMKEFLKVLQKNYYEPLQAKHPLIVFTDQTTSETLVESLQPFFSGEIVPAVIPEEELTRDMPSYSCTEGVKCTSGEELGALVHRGVMNETQFWSSTYLRISRYTAGPLFLHPALDQCGPFLKLDTDFFLTRPLQQDPLDDIKREGTRLAYWQLQLQGQRQVGYTQVSLGYLQRRGFRIRNPFFHARGRFLEQAETLGVDLEDEVPEAFDAAMLIYGCAFGGDIKFFREPLYQDFFRYMDLAKGFEQAGWSNQFFLGTAAAAFLEPSQTRRIYLSGRHQESDILIENGSITERLTGSYKRLLR